MATSPTSRPPFAPLPVPLRAALAAVAIDDGPLTHRYDETSGFVRVCGEGLWTPEQVDAHFDAIEQTVTLLRSRFANVKSLVDLRGAATQPQATSQRMSLAIARIYRPCDRIAIVVASSLLKVQMRHMVRAAPFEAFLSVGAAEIWLTAYD